MTLGVKVALNPNTTNQPIEKIKTIFFIPPHRKIGGILFYHCLSVCTNLFGMKAYLIDVHLVPRSRSSAKVKVKYQGHVSQKMCVSGALVFHKHFLSCFFLCQLFTTEQNFGLVKIESICRRENKCN